MERYNIDGYNKNYTSNGNFKIKKIWRMKYEKDFDEALRQAHRIKPCLVVLKPVRGYLLFKHLHAVTRNK